MKVTVKYTNRKRKNKCGFRKRMGTKSGRALLSRRRKKGRRELSAQLNFSIPSAEFNHVMKISDSLSVSGLSFKYTFRPQPALGLIVSKYYGNAVVRNLFKRRCRSLFRNNLIKRGSCIALIIRPKKLNISFMDMKAAFESLNEKICV